MPEFWFYYLKGRKSSSQQIVLEITTDLFCDRVDLDQFGINGSSHLQLRRFQSNNDNNNSRDHWSNNDSDGYSLVAMLQLHVYQWRNSSCDSTKRHWMRQ